MSRYVVTGSSGFIGRAMMSHLEQAGHEAVGWDRSRVDLFDRSALTTRLVQDDPEAIIHLAAAGVSHERAHDQKLIEENCVMTRNLLEACPAGLPVVLAGSMSEYGRDGVLNEDDPCSPTTAYGESKLAVTRMAIEAASASGPSIRIARLFGVYGPGEHPSRLFPMLLDCLRRGERVPLSDGRQARDFIHVGDVCKTLQLILQLSIEPATPLLVNVGTGHAVTVRDVATWMSHALGADIELLGFGERERSPGDSDLIVASTQRLHEYIGWVPPQRLERDLDPVSLFDRS